MAKHVQPPKPPKAAKPPEPLPETIVDMTFPTAGLDVSEELGMMPRRPLPDGSMAPTARDGLNVRSFDPTTDRLRGGSRPGLNPFIDSTVNGAFEIQELNLLVIADATAVGDDVCDSGLDSVAADRNTLGGLLGTPPIRHRTNPGQTFVFRACLVITADDQSTTVGGPITLNGTEFISATLVNGDVITTCTLSCDQEGLDALYSGDYPITPSAAVGINLSRYNITYVPGNLHVANS